MSGADAGALATLLRRIALLLLAPPSAEAIQALVRAAADPRADSLPGSARARAALVGLGAEAEPGRLAEAVDDYHRLFVVPLEARGYLAPFESAHCETLPVKGDVVPRLIGGRATRELALLYRESGFDAGPARGAPPDHMGVEIGFAACLSAAEARAEEAGDRAGVESARAAARTFIARHPGRWILWLAQAAHEARSRFYGPLLDAAWDLLRADLARLRGADFGWTEAERG